MARNRVTQDPRWLTAKFGNCSECRKDIAGQRAFYYPNTKEIFCEKCGQKHSMDFESHKFDEAVYNGRW